MGLADLGNPEALAAKIIDLVPGVPIPIPLGMIAERLGISEIRYEPQRPSRVALYACPAKPMAALSSARAIARHDSASHSGLSSGIGSFRATHWSARGSSAPAEITQSAAGEP
jgi:hypothetical protein